MNNYWTFEASDNFLIVRGRVTVPTHEWNFSGVTARLPGVSPATQAAQIVADIVSAQEKCPPGDMQGFGGYGGFVRREREKI